MNKESIEKIKKYPYKDGVISIIGASITIIVGLLTLLTCIYESDIIINNKLYIYFVSIVLIIYGLLWLWIGFKAINSNRELNKKLGGMAYKFDYKKELKKYKVIGRMEKQKEVYYFEKYMEWKVYVEQQYSTLINNENFYRFLNREYRNVKKEETIDKYIMIPIELLIPQIMISLNEWNLSEKIIIVGGHIYIGEIKGVNHNVKNENVSQLDVHYQSFLEEHPEFTENDISAILIMNHQKNKPVTERENVHEQQINLAKRNGSLIIESYILLKMYDKYTKNELTREECINMFQEEGLLVL